MTTHLLVATLIARIRAEPSRVSAALAPICLFSLCARARAGHDSRSPCSLALLYTAYACAFDVRC